MWGLRFMAARRSGKCGDFASSKLRGDWEQVLF